MCGYVLVCSNMVIYRHIAIYIYNSGPKCIYGYMWICAYMWTYGYMWTYNHISAYYHTRGNCMWEATAKATDKYRRALDMTLQDPAVWLQSISV